MKMEGLMGYYMSMQRVRFRSSSDYEVFKKLFAEVKDHLKKIEGFVHLSWWEHPDDPEWFNEVSVWTSKEATVAWHGNGYHKFLKKWGMSGPIMEDIVTNWIHDETKAMRVCPACGHGAVESYELSEERKILSEKCENCGFGFPYLGDTASAFLIQNG
jgi:heme-degrading monooxygenase HmoA